MDNKTIFIRLTVAFILGGLLGIERGRINKPAGIKTCISVALASSLTMMFGIYIAQEYKDVDPTRISAQVVSGIGFLGSLCVLKGNEVIVGITTASSIWAVACIGLVVGGGFISGACIATGFILFNLLVISKIDPFKNKVKNEEDLSSHQ